MKNTLIELTHQAISEILEQQALPAIDQSDIELLRPKSREFGDYSTNIAMKLAKPLKQAPKAIAQLIIEQFPSHDNIQKIEIAGPGFINFYLTQDSEISIIEEAISQSDAFGFCNEGKNTRIHIEFVSSNPTGPLHVGHGRSAAYGASVCNLLEAIGYDVHREYYVNDAGRQMRILALSIWIRYLQLFDIDMELPPNGYQGDYVITIATVLKEKYNELFLKPIESIQACFSQLNPDDKEIYIDQYIENVTQLLTEKHFDQIRNVGIEEVIKDIREDLTEFGVRFNQWFYESELIKKGWIDAGIKLLTEHGYTYSQDGALWFRATELGDEKDRVLIRSNGQPTYFASDVAYHTYKYDQEYEQIIDVFGADHHGYIPRLKAFLKGLGKDPDKLSVLIVQFAVLYRGKEKVSMSTRSGEFVTLRALREEVGNDAARFFYVMRKPDQHLDFDLELAKSTSNENPVYYIQYAHARIASVWRQLEERKLTYQQTQGLAHLHLLKEADEKLLMVDVTEFPEIIRSSALQYAPHRVAHFLHRVAQHFHAYYNAHQFIVEDEKHRNARLCLINSVQHVLRNGLTLLGVSAPNAM